MCGCAAYAVHAKKNKAEAMSGGRTPSLAASVFRLLALVRPQAHSLDAARTTLCISTALLAYNQWRNTLKARRRGTGDAGGDLRAGGRAR